MTRFVGVTEIAKQGSASAGSAPTNTSCATTSPTRFVGLAQGRVWRAQDIATLDPAQPPVRPLGGWALMPVALREAPATSLKKHDRPATRR